MPEKVWDASFNEGENYTKILVIYPIVVWCDVKLCAKMELRLLLGVLFEIVNRSIQADLLHNPKL